MYLDVSFTVITFMEQNENQVILYWPSIHFLMPFVNNSEQFLWLIEQDTTGIKV